MKFNLSIWSSLWLFIFSTFQTYSQNSLTVGNPQNNTTQKGTIEEAFLSIRNKGLYLEYGLYLTFSGRGSTYKSSDSLEIVLNFILPQKAVVTDSWLWIQNNICKANILDIWSASGIYENIVKRRRDPSILIKSSETQYTLKVYPLKGNETRKVKITYLVPLNWNTQDVSATIPNNILNTSRFAPSNFPIVVWSDHDFKNPLITSNPFGLIDGIDSLLGDYKITTIYPSGSYPNMEIKFSNPMKNGLYMNNFHDRTESIYQIAVQPSAFTDQIKNQKIAILIDYQFQTNVITKKELADQIKSELKNIVTDKDSFIVFFSNLSIMQSSSSWKPATASEIDSAFDRIEYYLLSSSNLPSLISAGIDFINKHQGGGKIVLFNNSDQFASYQTSNEIIKIVSQINTKNIALHILDYCNTSKSYQINNRTYYNNEYLFINLSNLSGGSYTNTRNGKSLNTALKETFQSSLPKIIGFDLHLKIEQGITYGKYPLSYITDNIPAQGIYTQTGLFRGLYPFTIEMSGEIERNIFNASITVAENELSKLDSLIKTIWVAQGIQKLEAQAVNNATIQDILYKSIQNRILSKYTAFLCLEDTTYYCLDCKDETQIPTANEDQTKDSLMVLNAFPNPFKDHLTIEIHSNQVTSQKHWLGEIVDISGRLVHRFKIQNVFKDGILQYMWDGKTDSGQDSPPGTYILVLHSEGKKLHNKVLKM